jgi:beta-1,4-mannosyl-glycoprotein beta-1,4-N-acetylglucosaminyltransferase
MKKYDLIIYNGEDIIELRFDLYKNIVDYFVILEFNRDYQGGEKKFFFNIKKYSNFKDKIIYIKKTCNNPNLYNSLWEFETFQRNSLIEGLSYANNQDFIILSDCDEIIEPKKLRFSLRHIYSYTLLNMRFFGNYLNTTSPFFTHPITASVKLAKEVGMQNLRMCCKFFKGGGKSSIYNQFKYNVGNYPIKKIKNSGYHFSSLKKNNLSLIRTIQLKHSQYSHVEYNDEMHNNINILKYKITKGIDIYNYGNRWKFIDLSDTNKIIYNWLKKSNHLNQIKNFSIKTNEILKKYYSKPILLKKFIYYFYLRLDKIIDYYLYLKYVFFKKFTNVKL